MRLFITAGLVCIDQERERALLTFAGGLPLPDAEQRTIAAMLEWFDTAIAGIDVDDEAQAPRYAGLVLDKTYLKLFSQGLLSETSGDRREALHHFDRI